MPIPLIPIAAGVGGAAVGAAIMSLFGGGSSKKEASSAPITHHAPYETYQPSVSKVYSPSYIGVTDSPGARVTKKDTTKPTVSPSFIQPTEYGGIAQSDAGQGTSDILKLAAIGGVAFIGYEYVKKGKS